MRIADLYFISNVVPEIKTSPIEYGIVAIASILIWVGIKIYQYYSDKKDFENHLKKIKKMLDK